MLGGQVSWCPEEESIGGTLVFDGAVFPPEQLGILREPIRLELEGGVVTSIEGGAEADVFRAWMASFGMRTCIVLRTTRLGSTRA